jgi:SAM-dependent methyltransferase
LDTQSVLALLVDLHRDGARQGPGSDADTLRALALARLDTSAALNVADIGCGTGAATRVLARALRNASIVAVDIMPAFLATLRESIRAEQAPGTVQALMASMHALPFAPASLDLIWSEGAIYNMGFARGVEAWRSYLRPGGVLAVSEITWLRPDPPAEIRQHWLSEYPEIATAASKIAQLETAGYDLVGYFVLAPASWLHNYYEPTVRRVPAFLERHAGRPDAHELVQMELHEAALYAQFQDWFSYGFYVARRR